MYICLFDLHLFNTLVNRKEKYWEKRELILLVSHIVPTQLIRVLTRRDTSSRVGRRYDTTTPIDWHSIWSKPIGRDNTIQSQQIGQDNMIQSKPIGQEHTPHLSGHTTHRCFPLLTLVILWTLSLACDLHCGLRLESSFDHTIHGCFYYLYSKRWRSYVELQPWHGVSYSFCRLPSGEDIRISHTFKGTTT